MAYIATRFPELIAFGFSGGPAFRTRIAATRSGKEQRNQGLSASLGRWTATHKHKGQTATEALIAYFQVANGRTNTFRFKDYADFAAAGSAGIVTLISGDTYQMKKRYTVGASSQDRPIYKPIAATVSISGGGSYSLAAETGIITRNSGAAPTGWTGQFDAHCRFDSDEMQIEIVERKAGGEYIYTWGDIAIVEVPL